MMFHGCPPSPDVWGRLSRDPVSNIYRGTATFTALGAGPITASRHFGPPKLTLIGHGLALLHGCFHVKSLNNQRGRPRVSVHIRALAGLGSTVVAHAREFRAADIQRTDQPTVQAIRHMGACCGRAASGRVPLRRNEVAMSHLLLVVDDRRSSAPKVVAASSIRDC